MRYYRVENEQRSSLIARNDDTAYDLTSSAEKLKSFADLAHAAYATDRSIDDVAEIHLENADRLSISELEEWAQIPVMPDEVWAAGVTYEISEEARKEESQMEDVYFDVYKGKRPELFFKATPDRTVGPDKAVGIRGDSDWNVPEPELGIVLYDGKTVGYTIGNDMSSRKIEGKNPLYLPQAKIYDRCCALGPCVVSPDSLGDPHDLKMSMTIRRDDQTVFTDSTSTNKMVRSCEELISYYTRHNTTPSTTVLFTGTSLVPEDDFTIQKSDTISIEIEGIGTLRNSVVQV